MTYAEIDRYIEYMDSDGLVALCKDIYKYRYITGKLDADGALSILSENLECPDVRHIEDAVIRVALGKFSEVVLLLFKDSPGEFLRQ